MNDITALLPDIKLRFNIAHPSYEESYSMGYESAMAYMAEEDNPFPKGSTEADHWLEGWWDATAGDDPLFDLNNSEVEEHLLLSKEKAANDRYYSPKNSLMSLMMEISGALAASALVGYQLFELVA